MALCSRSLTVSLFLLSAIAASAVQSSPIVRPGAHCRPRKLLTEATVRTQPKVPGNAGVELIPGVLTPQEICALAKGTGAQFDRLFLTGMIQRHGAALTMVDDLFNTPGAGQDPVLFDFATGIENTQSAEIKIMRGMPDKEKK